MGIAASMTCWNRLCDGSVAATSTFTRAPPRSVTAVDTAAVAASYPLSSREPGSPARSQGLLLVVAGQHAEARPAPRCGARPGAAPSVAPGRRTRSAGSHRGSRRRARRRRRARGEPGTGDDRQLEGAGHPDDERLLDAGTPRAPRRAPSSRPSMTSSCQDAATTATRRPRVRRLARWALRLRSSAGSPRCRSGVRRTWRRRRGRGEVVPHPVPLGQQVGECSSACGAVRTRSTAGTSMPCARRPATLAGLLVSSRTRPRPRGRRGSGLPAP